MRAKPTVSPMWMKQALLAAATYNIIWGGFAVFFPSMLFELLGMERPNYPELWQCIGMIVGVYGIGYAIAAFDPVRHWPVVLVGFLGKLLGPIGFVQSVAKGRLPWRFGLVNLTNDLIWLIPFGLILWRSYRLNSLNSERS
jgi:small multidrug resistance pump